LLAFPVVHNSRAYSVETLLSRTRRDSYVRHRDDALGIPPTRVPLIRVAVDSSNVGLTDPERERRDEEMAARLARVHDQLVLTSREPLHQQHPTPKFDRRIASGRVVPPRRVVRIAVVRHQKHIPNGTTAPAPGGKLTKSSSRLFPRWRFSIRSIRPSISANPLGGSIRARLTPDASTQAGLRRDQYATSTSRKPRERPCEPTRPSAPNPAICRQHSAKRGNPEKADDGPRTRDLRLGKPTTLFRSAVRVRVREGFNPRSSEPHQAVVTAVCSSCPCQVVPGRRRA